MRERTRGLTGLDETRLEGAMSSVLGDFADGAEDDPRQLARLLQRFSDAAGLEPGPKMEEMIRRLEGGRGSRGTRGRDGKRNGKR